MSDIAGYLFAYFRGEGHADGERVSFAISDGPSPLTWRSMAEEAELRSDVGTGGVRDPFLLRTPDGFVLLATDLRIHGMEGGWADAEQNGSRHILIWRSPDLRSWIGPERAELSPEQYGNAWAPEATFDPSTGRYLVYWASHPSPTRGWLRSDVHVRMLASWTEDFRTFDPAFEWCNPGYPVIDSTVVAVADGFYRFTKDERSSEVNESGKTVFVDWADALERRVWTPITSRVGTEHPFPAGITHGEGAIVTPASDASGWYLFIDEFGLRGYRAFFSASLEGPWVPCASEGLPAGARHGSILTLTQDEWSEFSRRDS